MNKLELGRPHISPMLHNKSQSHQPLVLEIILKGFLPYNVYGRGDHFGRVTRTI